MLSDRILSASTDDEAREVLAELFAITRGPRPKIWAVEYEEHTPEYKTYVERGWVFNDAIDARAYLSAAEMLVQPGYFWAVTMRGENRVGFHACYLREGAMEWTKAPTAWQALAAAIAKTREG